MSRPISSGYRPKSWKILADVLRAERSHIEAAAALDQAHECYRREGATHQALLKHDHLFLKRP